MQPFAFALGLPGLHVSLVHPLPSLQRAALGVPTQLPAPLHVSGKVQNTPSSQGLVLKG